MSTLNFVSGLCGGNVTLAEEGDCSVYFGNKLDIKALA